MSNRGLFEPDVLVVEQFIGGRQRGAARSSEKRLMLAVLENALHDFQKYAFSTDSVCRELFEEASRWIESPGNRGLFSFENISETLGIDPEYLRRGLAAWHKRVVEQQDRAAPLATSEAEAPIRAAG